LVVEHPLEEVVAAVVVDLAHLVGPRQALRIQGHRLHHIPEVPPGPPDVLVQVDPQDAVEELIERVAVPPAVHIGLARRERPARQHPSVEAVVVYLQIPGTIAVQLDIGSLKKGRQRGPCRGWRPGFDVLHGNPKVSLHA